MPLFAIPHLPAWQNLPLHEKVSPVVRQLPWIYNLIMILSFLKVTPLVTQTLSNSIWNALRSEFTSTHHCPPLSQPGADQ